MLPNGSTTTAITIWPADVFLGNELERKNYIESLEAAPFWAPKEN